MSILMKGIDMPEKHHVDCYYIDHDGRVLNISRNIVIGEAIQYEERKKGKWHRRFYSQIEMMVCSECQEEFSYDAETGIRDYNFCPNCGADMRGEENVPDK